MSLHGVKLVTEDAEGWTQVVKGEEMSSNAGIRIPVIKGNLRTKNLVSIEGDTNAEKLQLYYAKDIMYEKLNGSPGLTFRTGNTRRREWIPIASASPIATRTRTRLKS